MQAKIKELYSADTVPELLFGLMWARVLSSAISAVAQLDVADHLTSDTTHVSDLARATGTHEESLYRLLRCLAMAGIFEETDDRRFVHTRLSEALSASSRDSIKALALLYGQEWFTRPVDGLSKTIRSGNSAFDEMFGMGWVEYLQGHPEEFDVLNAGMEAATVQFEMPVLDRYDFSWADSLVDVGGGTGAFLTQILLRYPKAHGILAELEEAAEPARRNFEEHGLSDRSEVVTVDMFEVMPIRADACILKRVIHDWPDDKAITILNSCREVVSPDGRIAVIEPVVTGLSRALMDVGMMAFGGRERTAADFERLFAASGLAVSRIVPATRLVSVVEGKVV